MAMSVLGVVSCVVAVCVTLASAALERPVCQYAEALINSVDLHLADWDKQIVVGMNASRNCTEYLEFLYMSRDRIREELEHVKGNFTKEDEEFRVRGGGRPGAASSTTWAMTHMSKAASLVSAFMHIHGTVSAARRECLSDNLQLLFLMSFRRLKTLLESQLRHIWIVFQGTSELFRAGVGKWLSEVTELFSTDLKTLESVIGGWAPPDVRPEMPGDDVELSDADREEIATMVATWKPPVAQPHRVREESDELALSTVEVLRRDAFEEWDLQKPVLRALLRHVLPRDGHVADFCGGAGVAADFLNGTGLLHAYAFDSSPNIRLLSKGVVEHARLSQPFQLWRTFDIVLCLSAADELGSIEVWAQTWKNIESHADKGAVLSCGTGERRREMFAMQQREAPALRLDEELSAQLDAVNPALGICAFRK